MHTSNSIYKLEWAFLTLNDIICWMNALTQGSSLMKQTSVSYVLVWMEEKCGPNTKAETRSKPLQKSWREQDFIIKILLLLDD